MIRKFILIIIIAMPLEAQVLITPKKLFHVPVSGSDFRVGAKIDKTNILHFIGGYAICYLDPKLSFGVTLGMEISDGVASSQGFDLCDFGSGLAGLGLWYLNKKKLHLFGFKLMFSAKRSEFWPEKKFYFNDGKFR